MQLSASDKLSMVVNITKAPIRPNDSPQDFSRRPAALVVALPDT